MRRMLLLCVVLTAMPATAQSEPTRAQTLAALNKAVRFFHDKVAIHGGYVWVYSSDLQYRMGEGLAYDQRIWIQPPGTPAVAMAMLEAHRVTGQRTYLQAARDAADALVKGQLHSGGWFYSVTFDPQSRREYNYRVAPSAGDPRVRINPDEPGGWDIWKQQRYKRNKTLVDDDTTPAALRLLMQVDQALDFKDAAIHEAAMYALDSLTKAQYPIGAWSHNYDHVASNPPSEAHYPIIDASYPDTWSRKWPKSYDSPYVINDRISLNVIETFLLAHEIYDDRAYLDTAIRGGEFLLRAEMPQPQPAWAQQYNRHMEPNWERKFEPPAITGGESQDVLDTLMTLYQHTGDKRFLDAVGPALVYLRGSLLDDGKLARFYELQTNDPLYFTTDYELTSDRGRMPDHYSFVIEPRLDELAFRYRLLSRDGPSARTPGLTRAELAAEAQRIIDAMDRRGAWTEPGFVRDAEGKKVPTPDGVIRSQTFIDNVQALCAYLVSLD